MKLTYRDTVLIENAIIECHSKETRYDANGNPLCVYHVIRLIEPVRADKEKKEDGPSGSAG